MILLSNANPRVQNSHAQCAVYDRRLHGHRAALRRELHRVAEEVIENLFKFALIGENLRYRGVRLRHERNLFLVRQRPRDVLHVGDRGLHGEQRADQFHATGLDLRQI